MSTYEQILKNILENGSREQNRTGIDSIALPNVVYNHRMSDGFPLLTTRKIFHKSALIELEGFMKCITSKKWYKEQGTSIWNAWANPVEVEKEYNFRINNGWITDFSDKSTISNAKKQIQEELDDLGTFYAWQIRKFDEHYEVDNSNWYDTFKEAPNGVEKGFDQLKYILKELKSNPTNRRLVVIQYNPNQMHMAALPSCHCMFTVSVINNEINLLVNFRSWDFTLGGPTNIAYYATLILLLSKWSGFSPGLLTIVGANTHLYVNQLKGIEEWLKRDPKPWPTLEITCDPFKIEGDELKVLWTHKDVNLLNYNPHPPIKFEVAV